VCYLLNPSLLDLGFGLDEQTIPQTPADTWRQINECDLNREKIKMSDNILGLELTIVEELDRLTAESGSSFVLTRFFQGAGFSDSRRLAFKLSSA
jgi:hypothetical protein